MPSDAKVLRPPAEVFYADELAALGKADRERRPPGWQLSPRAVRSFICGAKKPAIERKFFGDDVLVERAIVGLAGNRGLLLVGEPGTAKSMLSELLAAAISGRSTNTIQGTAGTTEDQIKYSWNYALLLAEGPSPKALVPGALHVGMSQGTLVRFEEITRCPPEIQDTLVSVLSDKLMTIPELHGDERVLLARPGFNVIATANIRDRGVHEMSSALKRRFNFETVHPIGELPATPTTYGILFMKLITSAFPQNALCAMCWHTAPRPGSVTTMPSWPAKVASRARPRWPPRSKTRQESCSWSRAGFTVLRCRTPRAACRRACRSPPRMPRPYSCATALSNSIG